MKNFERNLKDALFLVQRKVRVGHDLGQGRGVINHLLDIDNLKVYGRSENQEGTLAKTIRVVSSNMCMEFGIAKCAVSTTKKGKLANSNGINLITSTQSDH